MSQDQRKRINIEELPQEQSEELTPEEAEAAKGGLSLSSRLVPMPPPIEPNVTQIGPTPPPI